MNQAQQRRTRRIKWISFLAIDLGLALALLFLISAREEVNSLQALDDLGVTAFPQQSLVADNFVLQDQSGRQFSAQQLQGKWSLVFFGFTNCPNICPLTMAELGQFYRALEADKQSEIELPQVIMVTVDPQRDDSEALVAYLDNYHSDFIGLTGNARQIRNFAEQLYVVIENNEDRDSATDMHAGHELASTAGANAQQLAAFDHSGHISVISPTGELLAVMKLPHRDQNISAAYQIIVDNWN